MHVRQGTEADLAGIQSILAGSSEAAQWEPTGPEVLVAEIDGTLAGFLVWRSLALDEAEILNLAVVPGYRRRGVGRALLETLARAAPLRKMFLEVRASNAAARALYRQAGFADVGLRQGYYSHPEEAAIVMCLQS